MAAQKHKPADYRAVVGIDYPDGRVEPGGACDAVPADAIGWLLACGAIEPKPQKKGR
jgi:hypothetical protein